MITQAVQIVIDEIIASGLYRALIRAGGYKHHKPHSRSDVDLYAISSADMPHHRYMERVDSRRVEITVYSYKGSGAL